MKNKECRICGRKLSTRGWGCATALSAIGKFMEVLKNDAVLQRPI